MLLNSRQDNKGHILPLNRTTQKSMRMAYLRCLWKKTDGNGKSQAEGGETHSSVDRQDKPRLSLQQGEPGGTRRNV